MKLLEAITAPFKKIRATQKMIAGWIKWSKQIKPTKKFHELPTPSAPDYSKLECWAAHPEVPNKSSFAPEGFQDNQANAKADVFFVNPTTYFGKESWNADLNHIVSKEFVDEAIMAGQASVFNGACRIFAPRYRQATFYSFLEGGKNARQALELAYSDVAAAFDYYMEHYNNGRPFFIAGHSQGALMCFRLLEEKIDKTELWKQMVAAYPIGFQLPMDKFGDTLKNLKPSENATDSNCVIAWDTYVADGQPQHARDKAEIWYPTEDGKGKWVRRAKKKVLGVNPLNWKRGLGIVSKENNLGAAGVAYPNSRFNWDGMWGDEPLGLDAKGITKPEPGAVEAEIRADGFLYISQPTNRAFRLMVMPGGNYHNYDYALFYMNYRKNVIDRLEAFLKK